MSITSRRRFLKAAGAAAALAASNRVPMWAQTGRPGTVKVWRTFRDQRHQQGEPLMWKPAGEVAPNAIVMNPEATKQEVLGFGAAMTDAACYVLSQMSDVERSALMREIFSPDEMAFNVCRTCIGSSDYSRSVYSFNDSAEPDPKLTKFSIDHDKAYILPMLREARKLNPGLFLFSSPWSPPGWMKPNNSMLGGSMRGQSFAPYAEYFLRFLDGYRNEGVAIDAVTVQNEVDAEQWGLMPACLWAQEQEMAFVKDHLGPALRKAGSPTKIWVLDHSYNLWGRALGELSDPQVYEYIDGVAWHGYVGEPSAMTRVHDAFPRKNAYWTEGGPYWDEGGPKFHMSDYQTDWTKWAANFNAILNNWARSITAWNLALDEYGKPNIGPFSCGGTITIENGSHKVTRSGQYWAFAHLSRHVKRGARVFVTNGLVSDGSSSAVSHTGFRNPDGSYVVVLANSGTDMNAELVFGSQLLKVELPADSVQTLEWS